MTKRPKSWDDPKPKTTFEGFPWILSERVSRIMSKSIWIYVNLCKDLYIRLIGYLIDVAILSDYLSDEVYVRIYMKIYVYLYRITTF